MSDSDFEERQPSNGSKQIMQKPKRKKVINSNDWTDTATLQLIDYVETHPCIWNKRLKEYHDKSIRDSAWREISDMFEDKFPTQDLTAKWTNLRIQFNSYSTKAKACKSGQGAGDYQVHWRFYKKMLFLKAADVRETTTTESNFMVRIEVYFILFFIVK